jgi:DNA-directed RNA polymerase specialized sigma24 family protein
MTALENNIGETQPGHRGLPGRGVDVPVLLARWRSRELWTARQFRACGGASLADVEELYDETIAVLVERDDAYESAEHLRAALHRGIKMRAMRLHRDRQTRSRTLTHAAPVIDATGHEQAWRSEPEQALIAREDDLIIGEFIAELTDIERRVFALVANGRSWRAIATALELSDPAARKLTRACERKRERFLTLYTTGRLCGYRSQTISALQTGAERGALALDQAVAHLRHCRKCQVQHRIDATTLRARFDAQTLGVLPAPALVGKHTSLLDRLHASLSRIFRLLHREPAPPSGLRERAVEALAGSGATAKLAAGVISAVLLAGGALHAAHPATHHRAHLVSRHAIFVPAPRHRHPAAPPKRSTQLSHKLPSPSQQHTPGGFSYLGVPARPRTTPSAPVVKQHGGGPFWP